MAVRTAIIQSVNAKSDGTIVYKDNSTIASVMTNLNQRLAVFQAESGSAPNAAKAGAKSAPTLHEYLNLEATDGYSLVHLDQTFVITQN